MCNETSVAETHPSNAPSDHVTLSLYGWILWTILSLIFSPLSSKASFTPRAQVDLTEAVTEQLKEAEMAEWSDLAAAEQTFSTVPSIKSGELRSGNHEQI